MRLPLPLVPASSHPGVRRFLDDFTGSYTLPDAAMLDRAREAQGDDVRAELGEDGGIDYAAGWHRFLAVPDDN